MASFEIIQDISDTERVRWVFDTHADNYGLQDIQVRFREYHEEEKPKGKRKWTSRKHYLSRDKRNSNMEFSQVPTTKGLAEQAVEIARSNTVYAFKWE